MFTLNQITLKGTLRPRLDDVTATIPAGRTAVVGYSGAGKTSLLNVLAGFETPDAGTVVREFSSQKSERLPLFWVPQNGGLWPHLTVSQHLVIVGGGRKVPEKAGNTADSPGSSDLADEILEELDLVERRSAFPAELSQGERSRLALARALVSDAQVLLLDEPLSHVDPVRKPDYWKAVQRMATQDRITMIFSSHEPETVLRQADSVVCLHEGRVVFQGTTRTLYDSPPSHEVGEFLGPLNWFEPEAAGMFLGPQVPATGSVGVRPERLQLTTDESSPIEFVSMPFRGGYAESLVKHVPTGRIRTVLHQVRGEVPTPGQRIAMRIAGIGQISEGSMM